MFCPVFSVSCSMHSLVSPLLVVQPLSHLSPIPISPCVCHHVLLVSVFIQRLCVFSLSVDCAVKLSCSVSVPLVASCVKVRFAAPSVFVPFGLNWNNLCLPGVSRCLSACGFNIKTADHDNFGCFLTLVLLDLTIAFNTVNYT